MFTGIIQQIGRVVSIEQVDFGAALAIDSGGWSHRPVAGESIAVNGCCLTLVRDAGPAGASDPVLRFDVIRETLDRTTLGDLGPDDPVNLESAVTPATLLSGHIVQGHVDGVGTISRLRSDREACRMAVQVPPGLREAIVEKGSVAMDGVSLTIAAIEPEGFEVALIPTTLDLTTLGTRGEGDRVNIETDYIAKVVVSWLRRNGS